MKSPGPRIAVLLWCKCNCNVRSPGRTDKLVSEPWLVRPKLIHPGRAGLFFWVRRIILIQTSPSVGIRPPVIANV